MSILKLRFISISLLILFSLSTQSCGLRKTNLPVDELAVVTHSPDAKFYETMIYDFIMGVAREQYSRRHNSVENLMNVKELHHRQKYLRESFLKMIGGLPERTPLNPRVVGKLDKGDILIEKVIFESLPKFYVTGLFYLPKERAGPIPGIFSPCGHSEN